MCNRLGFTLTPSARTSRPPQNATFSRNLEANRPKESPLVDEGHVGDSGTGQRQEAAGSATSSKPLITNDLNMISGHESKHL